MSKPENTVDHVLDRMVEAVLGEDARFESHALALGIPHNTIRTWKRRGEVPLGYLKNFAADWKVSLDWLLRGEKAGEQAAEAHQVSENVRPYGLSADESALLESYRRASPETQTALRVLAGCGGTPPTPRPRVAKPARIELRDGARPERKPGAVRKKRVGET